MASQGLPPAYDHQRRAVAYAEASARLGRRGIYLNHVVGAGKTRTALGIAKQRKAKRVLVLAPLIALGVWARETKKWWPLAGVVELRGAEIPKRTSVYEPVVLCINYDLLNPTRVRDILKHWKPDLLILDEAHYAKTPTSVRTGQVRNLAKKIPFSVLLSGTPAHDPLDWWAQYRLIAPDDPVWSLSFGNYKRHVAILGGPQQNWVQGFRDPVVADVVARHVLPYTHVVGRDELKLPEPVESVIPFPLSEKERGLYQEIEKQFTITVPELADPTLVAHQLTQLEKMRQVASGFVQVDLPNSQTLGTPAISAPVTLGTSKLQTLLEIWKQRQEQNVVIACRYAYSIQKLKHGLPAARILDGSTPAEERTRICEWFQQPGQDKIVLLQHQAGGVAITLSKADVLIFYELPLSAIQYEQVRGRIDRPGKPDFQEVLILAAEDTLEEDIYVGVKQHLDEVSLARHVLAGVLSRK